MKQSKWSLLEKLQLRSGRTHNSSPGPFKRIRKSMIPSLITWLDVHTPRDLHHVTYCQNFTERTGTMRWEHMRATWDMKLHVPHSRLSGQASQSLAWRSGGAFRTCNYVSWYGHVTLTSSSPLWSPVSYLTFHTVQTSYAPKQNSPGSPGPPFKHLCIPRQQPGQRKPHKDQTSYHQVGWDGINAWLLKPKLLECQPTSVQMQSLLLTSNYSVAVPNEIAVWPVQWHINQMQCRHRHYSWSLSTSASLVNNSSGRQESSLLSAVLFDLNHNRAQACPTRHQFWHGTGRKLELQLLLLARDIALRKDRKAMWPCSWDEKYEMFFSFPVFQPSLSNLATTFHVNRNLMFQ